MKEYLIGQAARMGIEMTPEQADDFCVYHEMLISANREMNLTRVSEDEKEASDRNYLDSLTALKHLNNAHSLIDVGSGAGFPGLPIAIMRRDMEIVLLDSLTKRVDFLTGVIRRLGLNAVAVHARCEEAARLPAYRDHFDAACARAVASMNVLSEWLLPFVKPGGQMLALKGPGAGEETHEAQAAIEALGARAAGICTARIPGRDWEHSIVKVEKLVPTPDRFPRKPGIAEKRPIK